MRKRAKFVLTETESTKLASESGSTPAERVKKALIRALLFSFQEADVEFRGTTPSDTTRVLLADGTEVLLRSQELGSTPADENSSS